MSPTKSLAKAPSKRLMKLFKDFVFVKDLGQFYSFKERIFYKPYDFKNSYYDKDKNILNIALSRNGIQKVTKIDYAPKQPKSFKENNISYANLWTDKFQPTGIPGDITPWLNHFDLLGWSEYKEHIIQWMAFTLLHPDKKINHGLLFGGGEGAGKDFILYPLTMAMANNHRTIEGGKLSSEFNPYLLNAKHLHINEVNLAGHKDAVQITEKLKPLLAAPPKTLSVNEKNVKYIEIRNIVNVTMTTNAPEPLKFQGDSRRFFAAWTSLNTKNSHGQTTTKWKDYWTKNYTWMESIGWQHVTYYLLNNVDLSSFNPGAEPLRTEYLKELCDNSKSQLQSTLEELINKAEGRFKHDLLTSQDIANIINSDKNITIETNLNNVGKTLREIPGIIQLSGKKDKTENYKSVRLNALRNSAKYKSMTPSKLYKYYLTQDEELYAN